MWGGVGCDWRDENHTAPYGRRNGDLQSVLECMQVCDVVIMCVGGGMGGRGMCVYIWVGGVGGGCDWRDENHTAPYGRRNGDLQSVLECMQVCDGVW